MSSIFIIFLKILPTYFTVVLGHLAGKILEVQRQSIANLLIYILAPIVVFSATLNVKIDLSIAFLPVFYLFFLQLLLWYL